MTMQKSQPLSACNILGNVAHLSHRNAFYPSVSLSHGWISQKTVQARITKSSLSAAWIVSATVKLFHKFIGGHPK